MRIQREETAAYALAALGIRRFVKIMQALDETTSPFAVKLMKDHLARGKSVQEAFFTGEENGFQLSVTMDERGEYSLDFGCLAGPLAGDGSSWVALFDEYDELVRVIEGDFRWIS